MFEYRFVGEIDEHFLHPEIGTVRPGQRVRTTAPVQHARLIRIAPLPRKRAPKAKSASGISPQE